MNKSFFDELKDVAPFVSYYSVICGFLYLYTYWFRFDIYPFDFIGLLDVLALSGKFLVFVGSLIFYMAMYQAYKGEQVQAVEISDRNPIGYMFFAAIIFFIIPLSFSYKWQFLEYIAASALLTLVAPIFKSRFLRDSILNVSIRMAVVSTLIIMPLGSIFLAITESNRVIGFVAQIKIELGFSLTPYLSKDTLRRWRTQMSEAV